MKGWIDGSCEREGFGRIGIGIIFENGKSIKRTDFGKSLDAEFLACIIALAYLDKHSLKGNIIYTDNTTLKKFFKNTYIPSAKKYKEQILDLVKKTDTEIELISRKKNRIADRLSKEALNEK